MRVSTVYLTPFLLTILLIFCSFQLATWSKGDCSLVRSNYSNASFTLNTEEIENGCYNLINSCACTYLNCPLYGSDCSLHSPSCLFMCALPSSLMFGLPGYIVCKGVHFSALELLRPRLLPAARLLVNARVT